MLGLNLIAENSSDYRLRKEHRPHLWLEPINVMPLEQCSGETKSLLVSRENLGITLERQPTFLS